MQKQEEKITLLSWGLLIILAVIWGSSFILIKRGVEGLEPMQMASLRIFSAFLCLLPFVPAAFKHMDRKRWRPLILSGLTGNLIPAYLFAFAQTQIDSSVSGIMNSLSPLFTLIIGSVIYRQKFNGAKIAGVVVGLLGCIILVVFKSDSFELNLNYYALLLVAATACYGTSANILKYEFQDMRPLYVSSMALLTVGPLAGVVFFYYDGATVFNTPESTEAALYTILLGFLSTALALVLFNKLIKQTTAVFGASVTYLIPIVAIGWGLFDGETLGIMQLAGMGVILIGVYLVKR